MKVQHGGDIYSIPRGTEILDFSVNLNPMGPPPAVLQAAQKALERSDVYPDPTCRALKDSIGQLHGVPPEWIACGNGASELIYRILQSVRPQCTLLPVPCFSEYPAALQQVGGKIIPHPLREEDNFDLTGAFLEQITPGVDLVMLCNPNNPTGRVIPRELLIRILDRCRRTGTVLMLDECFWSLTEEDDGMVPFVKEYPGLVILRAFTKSHAIPALRIGYCLSGDRELMEKTGHCGPSWNVSGVAQAAGVACCTCDHWPRLGREILAAQRPRLLEGLEGLGLQVVPGQGNFILFRRSGDTTLKQRLLEQGILIRQCDDYQGLGPDWYRVAVKNQAENLQLVRALGMVL